jgi:hypothetical protein
MLVYNQGKWLIIWLYNNMVIYDYSMVIYGYWIVIEWTTHDWEAGLESHRHKNGDDFLGDGKHGLLF